MKKQNVLTFQQLSREELIEVEAGQVSIGSGCPVYDTCPNAYPGCYSGDSAAYESVSGGCDFAL
jgi:hypothetical protein